MITYQLLGTLACDGQGCPTAVPLNEDTHRRPFPVNEPSATVSALVSLPEGWRVSTKGLRCPVCCARIDAKKKKE